MKFISWNVNGLRACMNKGFKEFFDTMDADIFAIQETKMQENQKNLILRVTMSIGIRLKRKDTREPLSILKKNRLMSSMVLWRTV